MKLIVWYCALGIIPLIGMETNQPQENRDSRRHYCPIRQQRAEKRKEKVKMLVAINNEYINGTRVFTKQQRSE
jgi:hypothetical protein